MTSSEFAEFVGDQLGSVSNLGVRRMFGGFGLYQGTIFFGLISGGRLYFKTNAQSREKYLLRGMEVFQPNDRQKLKNYFEVPADVIEDRMTLTEWAKEAAAIQ